MINCFVHVVMYSYYFISTYPQYKDVWWKKYITHLQLVRRKGIWIVTLTHSPVWYYYLIHTTCTYLLTHSLTSSLTLYSLNSLTRTYSLCWLTPSLTHSQGQFYIVLLDTAYAAIAIRLGYCALYEWMAWVRHNIWINIWINNPIHMYIVAVRPFS